MIAAVGASRASTFAAVPVTCLAVSDYSKASFRTSCRLQLAASTASPGGVFDQPAATSMTLMGGPSSLTRSKMSAECTSKSTTRLRGAPASARTTPSLRNRAAYCRSHARSGEEAALGRKSSTSWPPTSPFGRKTRISAKRIPSELTCLRHVPTREAECVHIDESILLRGVWPFA
jgi:hypothetical protein